MTIKGVLKADWTVDNIKVTVRDAATMKFITEYHIGENLQYPMYFYCFDSIQEMRAGTIYENMDMKHLYMECIIQHLHLPMEDKKRGQEGCVGVLLERIPKELLEYVDDEDDLRQYIVTIDGAERATALRYAGDGTWWEDGIYYPVIAWQPLPELYHPEEIEKSSK